MRFFVDLDNTVAETSIFEYEMLRNWYPKLKKINKEDIIFDNLRKYIKHILDLDEKKIKFLVNEIYSNKWFWENIPVMENSVEVLKNISKKNDIFFATSTFNFGGEEKFFEGCLVGKLNWIKKNFPFISLKNVIYTDTKYLLKGDYLIEDKPSQLKEFEGKKVLMDFPYNRNTNDFIRVNNWKEIEKII